MNNKLILDLTVRLTQALDQNYDVVNMDTVLAVLSALEGATITKEQLETTRLAKHINQLRRRNKSNTLAIRAKNLLKTWREMVGITSQAQSEVATSASQLVQSSQQQAPKPPLSSSSQPTSPYTTQLLGENLDNSLSSIGGGVEFSRTATGGVINTGSVNFGWSKKSSLTVGEGGGGGGIISSRSNGALTDTQTRLMKSSNRSTKNSNSPSLPGTTSKVKHPTSFKNLLTGFNANSVSNKQTNPSALSPKLKSQISCIEREEPSLKTNSTTFVIDDDDNQSQPSTTAVVQTGVSSPRTHKSTKRKERDSPVTMVFIEQSNSPIPFDNMSEENERNSQVARNTSNNQVVTSTIDLPDSNSSSTFVNALCEATNVVTGNGGVLGSTGSNSNTRIRKDKQKQITESEHFQPNIDESSRIAFPISGIQEYLSLSNSSMSIFPSQQTAGSGGTERYPPKMGSIDDNQHQNSSTERNTEVVDGDLTFAGKFKQNSNSCGIEVGSTGNYFSNGKENSTLATTEFPCSNMKVVENNCRDSLSAGGTASTSTFLPFSRNSNESTSNSRASQLDLIDVVNQDSQSMITADDLRQQQQQQSSNQKSKNNRDVESAQDTQQVKYTKETSNKSKQLSKEQSTKPAVVQKPINTSSKPSTPTPAPNAIPTNTLSPHATEQKVPKKRGRKKGSKGVDSVLAQMSGLSSQFLVSPALGSSKKVKTTMELLADIQNRKLGSATSSPTLMNWLGTSRPASSCSEPSLHSPRTSDACSTNATVSTAARSTPEKNISNNSVAADELYESDSDSNTSEPSHDSVKVSLSSKDSASKSIEAEGTAVPGTAAPTTTIEAQIKDLMAQLPPVNVENIDWEACEDVPCTCTLREVLPEAVVEIDSAANANENELELLKDVESIKSKDDDNRQDDDEPIISVNVLPPAPRHHQQQPSSVKSWSAATASTIQHSLSAPVSTVTSPVVPSTNQRPMKSIFDLDFDDDNDPLHSFVEAATKSLNSKDTSSATTENGRIKHTAEEVSKQNHISKTDHSDVGKSETQQSEATQQSSSIESASYQYPPAPLEMNEPMMPPLVMFPTYEVVEDPNCQAKLRYDTQTNQITQFHVNALHNCFIPNVNGNWDHSVPQNIDDQCQHMENDSLYANVVPNYGCFVTERIPKDLSHVKFTKNFKPKHTDKSDKPPPPFLGVANIHRRQHFRLHHHHNHHRKHHKKTAAAAGQRKRHFQTKVACVKTEAEQKIEIGIKKEKVDEDEHQNETEKEEEDVVNASSVPNRSLKTNVLSYIPEQKSSAPNATENKVTEVKEIISTVEHRLSPTHVPEISQMNTHNTNLNNYSDKSYPQQRTINNHKDNNVADIDFFPVVSDIEQEKRENREEPYESHSDHKSDIVDMKRPIANGTVHHLMNNNSIVHGTTVETGRDEVTNNTKAAMQNNNHGLLIDGKEDEIAASRRSSSCSNSSLKQNQNSINMKLRRHRLAQRQAEMQKRHRKRKNLSELPDVFQFAMEIARDGETDDPPLIKRIKIVNGGFADGRRMTNSITDSSCMEEDGDSDCYHVHSENDIITEEEIDEDGDEQAPKEMDEDDDYEDIADDYDEEDGDDEEEPEEDYGDFREVVTRDMTSSTTGNNHIVLTIKKTPSKTNSPSSSSMSPAPIISVNVKQPSISPTIRAVDALLLGENTVELPVDPAEHEYQDKDKLGLKRKLIELGSVKAEDLIGKTEFFLPEPSEVAIYSFEVKKKNGDIEHEDSANEDNDSNERSNDNPENQANAELPEVVEIAELPETTEETENNNSETKDHIPEVPEVNPKEFQVITKAKLSESILTTRRELRRLDLKRRLREGIEEAQKMHRQLFFPYELNTSIGSKILEINSCTSGCTDPSDDETDTTDSDTSTSSTDDEDALFRVQKRKRTILPSKRRRTAGGGGGDPSSSSSSSSDSSDDSNSTSSSYSAFTSWTTSSEDEDRKLPIPEKKEKEEQNDEQQHSSSNLNDTDTDVELPLENNYLLRSFNHIYVSTEERRRQQQLKEAAEYRRREIMNAGYITITGEDSKEDTVTPLIPSLASSDNCDVYTNYYNNPTYNIYPNSSNSIGNILLTTTPNLTANAETSKAVETPSAAGTSTANFNVIEMPPIRESSPTESSSQILDFLIEQTSPEEQATKEDEIPEDSSQPKEVKTEQSSKLNCNDSKSNQGTSDNNNVDGQTKNINNNETVQEAEVLTEPNNDDETLVPQEEYRTGLRQVDEDVDDEDGNNCARTQQFKEWHEVLQLRSYNDELLTVLPYVVIE